ncbi:TPA: ParM/StbA family protein [Enterococcus faecium]|nr:ParM/StbA family protein [Enterococcus faecium]
MKEPLLFSVDLGNKSVKEMSTHVSPLSLPSRILNKNIINSGRFSNIGSSLKRSLNVSEYSLVNTTESYYFGKDIHELGKDDYVIESLGFGISRYKQETYQNILSFSLANLARLEDQSDDVLTVNLVLGLPSSDYTETIVKYVMQQATRQHSVEVDGKAYNINVDTVWVLPQPIGTLYNLLLADDGSVQDETLISQKIGFVDIGGGTKLFDVVQNFEIDENNREQKDTGIFTLYNRIVNMLDLPISPNAFQLEKIIREGKEKGVYLFKPSGNESFNISEVVEREIKTYTNMVVAEVLATFKNFTTLDKVVFTGGGASIIDKQLVKDKIPHTLFVEDSEFSNVKGFYKFGLTQ